jgi:3-deoxy-D-manno-octulosonate 8-phosphate phosphatase (KDO 8-P phosphatase)
VHGLEQSLRKIRLLALDVDGVLTDGLLISHADGTETKAFHAHDGQGIGYLRDAGIQIALVTGRTSVVVQRRAAELGIEEVHQGDLNKIRVYERLLQKLGLKDENVAFVGDDLPDIPVLRRAGVSVAVANARPEVKACAMYTTQAPGGAGAVREVAELILKAQGHWDSILRKYLSAT